jgi:uncharacterized protein
MLRSTSYCKENATLKPETLTTVERKILANQFLLLEKLDPDGAEYYAESRDIIEHGYTIFYEEVLQSIFAEMPIDDCRYVFDVLDMHRALRTSYDKLTDKGGITEDDIRFRGFDGNNESKRYAFAEFLKKTGKWQETLAGGLNSHSMVTMHLYPKMLEKYNRIVEKHKKGNAMHEWWLLSAEEIKEVIGQ